MVMNGDVLGTAIAAAIGTAGLESAEITALETKWKTIATQIITHISTNAVVAVASVSAVTVGTGVSGPGAGTIS